MMAARSSAAREHRRRLPLLALTASTSTLVPSSSRGVNMVPTLLPLRMFLMVLSFIPLQMTTLHPLFNAYVADITLDSIPPVPCADFSPNLMLLLFGLFGLK